jgi:hypothetical protein
MTDAEINSFVYECCRGWLGQGATPGDILAIGAGIMGNIAAFGGLSNEKCHEALASILQQRSADNAVAKGTNNG